MGAIRFYVLQETEAKVLARLRYEIGEARTAWSETEWSIQEQPRAREYTPEDPHWIELLEEWHKQNSTTPACLWEGHARIHT